MDSVPLFALNDCDVMTTNGSKLGTLENITLNPNTGELKFLCVNPSSEESTEFPQMENGQVVVPVDSVETTREYLIVTAP
ncbi:PRC-barrel domain-containing protein [Halobellus limi]|jgi:sporulation protein YlmC with PRC-barrel domain|uniref:Photosystem reaction center subunit H n=1 Tax=Halobellus limi TaxID=699433 RepID=A0A1H6BT93_9EURY|nr:PRC-barrel domain-containing protein [Halobellus limi]QCC49494.1 photosystem reaction center subunit H [Halobellus limi]SEG63862.1 Sporulation protein YlmC, PRC-barrel domain family [Halobellus limi]